MQNSGQTWVFYKLGQTRLTGTKRDPVDLDNSDDPTQFQPWQRPMGLKTLIITGAQTVLNFLIVRIEW